MSQLRDALRRAGSCAAALALIGSAATWLAPSVVADSPTIRYVAAAANGGSDTVAGGAANDCKAQANPCLTIQHAVDEANAGDTVSVEAGAFDVTPPTWGPPYSRVAITKSITVQGAGADKTSLTTSDNGGVGGFAVDVQGSGDAQNPIVVHLQDLSLVDDGSGYNLGVLVESGGANLTLGRVQISGYLDGGVLDEQAMGADPSNVTITDSTVTGNQPGVEVEDGTLTILSSTIAGNVQQGIYVRGGAAVITDSTIAGTLDGDRGPGEPGGVVVEQGGGEGLGATATATIAGSIVASQQDTLADCVLPDVVPDAPKAITSDGFNLDSDGSCGFDQTGDLSKADPKIGRLADNGGPTLTMMPLDGSPVIDAIPNKQGTCNDDHTTDQRGTARPIGSGCDIGAVETPAVVLPPSAPPTCPPLVIDTTTLPDGTVGTPYSVQLQASGGCDNLYSWIVPSDAPDGGFPSVGEQTTAPAGEQTADARPADGQPVFTPTLHRSPVAAPTSQAAATDTPVSDSPVSDSAVNQPAGNAAPPGLTLGADGVLSGTPTQAGTFTFTVSVNDPVLTTLVLHVAAAATSTPAPSSSVTTPTAAGSSHGVGGVSTTAAPPVTATASSGSGPLANTGAPVGPQLRVALMLLVGGGALVLAGARRRRRPRQH